MGLSIVSCTAAWLSGEQELPQQVGAIPPPITGPTPTSVPGMLDLTQATGGPFEDGTPQTRQGRRQKFVFHLSDQASKAKRLFWQSLAGNCLLIA
jgi:hypothetical protein